MNKYIIIILAIVVGVSTANAQSGSINDLFGKSPFGSASKNLVSQSVKEGLYVVKQEYILSDTTSVNPRIYGYDNNDYFGRDYALGIVVGRDLITYSSILEPWSRDSNYERYRNNRTVVPKLSKRHYRALNQDSYVQLADSMQRIGVANIFMDADSIKGFNLEKRDGEIEGWVVTLSGDKTKADSVGVLKIDAYTNTMTISDAVSEYEIRKISIASDLMGGFYIVPTFNEIGIIELKVIGMLYESDDKWFVSTVMPSAEVLLTPIEVEEESATPEPTLEENTEPENRRSKWKR